MSLLIRMVAATAIGALLAVAAVTDAAPAQAARAPGDASVFLPIENEPPARLFVDPPIAARLAAGSVLIPYRTENFRILPIFGPSAIGVSPRAGHLHVTVDDLPWHWADASDDRTIVIVGMPPGVHKVRVELARPDHGVFTGQTVTFTVPVAAAH